MISAKHFGRLFATVCATVLFMGTAFAQTVNVKGTVVDTKGQPVIGASIVEVGTSNGTTSDVDGSFVLTSKAGATLEVTCIGYATKQEKASASIKIVLEEDNEYLDEVVVVGYGKQKKVNLTGAVASVDVAKTIDSRPITDIGRALQGAVPGLTVTTNSGEIGGAPTIKIRGSVSSPNGSGNPLILVDNVEVSDISLVNPDDIESISVLKDAASSSIYGARAAFGVILITTKANAKNDRITVKYSNNFSWRTPTKTPVQLPAWQEGEIDLMAAKNTAADPNSVNYYDIVGNMRVDAQSIADMKSYWEQYGYGDQFGDEFVEGRDFYFRDGGMYFIRPSDWYGKYVRSWAPQMNHTLAIAGGNGKTNYNISLGYLGQEGMMKINSDNFKRFNGNVSLNTEITKWLTARIGVMYTNSNYEYPMNYNSDLYDAMYYLYRWQAFYPYGTYKGQKFRSGLTELAGAPKQTREREFKRFNAGVTIKPLEGLTIDLDGSYYTTDQRFKRNGDITAISGIDVFSTIKDASGFVAKQYLNSKYDYVEQQNSRTAAFAFNGIATYKKKIQDHDFTVMLGTNIEKSEYTYMMAKRMGLLEPSKPELNLATGNMETGSSHTWWSVAGFFGRINYVYKDKWLLELNGRYDGSSRFPSGNRFAFFPSGSLGYRMSEEEFWQPIKNAVSSLKFRASYGMIGNQDVGTDRFVSTLSTSTDSWIIDGAKVQSTGKPTIVSDALSWEKVTTIDAGVDARFIKDVLGVSFDWYRRTTSDILTAANLPQTLGATAPYENTGEIRTDGWELAIDFHQQYDNGFSFDITGSLSDAQTVVTKWTNNTSIPTDSGAGSGWYSTSYYKEGMVLGDIWGLQFDRFLTSADFNADGTLKEGLPDQTTVFKSGYRFAPGDVLYKDINGDGKISKGATTTDPGDYSVIGNIFPRLQYGLNFSAYFKGFDFNIFFQGVGKKNYWAAGNQVLPGYQRGEPYYTGQDDYWTENNQDAFYPRPINYQQGQNGNFTINNRYMLNMSYFRLKTLTLGYSLPKKWMDAIHMQKARIYFTGENLLTFDQVKAAIDPETGARTPGGSSDSRNFGRIYPYVKTLSFGIQLTF